MLEPLAEQSCARTDSCATATGSAVADEGAGEADQPPRTAGGGGRAFRGGRCSDGRSAGGGEAMPPNLKPLSAALLQGPSCRCPLACGCRGVGARSLLPV